MAVRGPAITGAITSVTGSALSPKLIMDETESGVFLEDPSSLWGSQWNASQLWSNGYFWANSTTNPGYLEANGYFWANATQDAADGVYANGYFWARNSPPPKNVTAATARTEAPTTKPPITVGFALLLMRYPGRLSC